MFTNADNTADRVGGPRYSQGRPTGAGFGLSGLETGDRDPAHLADMPGAQSG